MTNGENFTTVEAEASVERTAKLDSVLRSVIVHTDTLDAGYQKSHPDYRRDWRDYVSPLVTRAYENNIDISDEEATRYVKDYVDNPPRPPQPEEQVEPELPSNELQGESND